MKKNLLIVLICLPVLAKAQVPGSKDLGNWFMYFGANKVGDKISIHTEAQHRNYDIIGNMDQLLLRTGVNWHHSPNMMITGGYAHIFSRPVDKSLKTIFSTEYRIWQQLILRNKIGRLKFEHRYRLEQRWVDKNDQVNYFNRARYRIFASFALNKKTYEPGTIFLAWYDEVFLNLEGTENLAQNRLYGAIGYTISKPASVQVGYLNQIIGHTAFHRLQLGLFLNLDFRKVEDTE